MAFLLGMRSMQESQTVEKPNLAGTFHENANQLS